MVLTVVASILPAQQLTVQQPSFGVSIDVDGVLTTKVFPDPAGKLFAKRLANARNTQPADMRGWSDLRKISLVGLEQALTAQLDAGGKPDDAMLHLAGLQRAQFMFFYPEERDIVIAGPAEGWVDDLSGRAVGLTTGRPTLLLEDLLVALRAYRPGRRDKPYIGCSIDPRPEGLENLARFQKTIPKEIPEEQREQVAVRISQGMRDSLGLSNIRVFGVSAAGKTLNKASKLFTASFTKKYGETAVRAPVFAQLRNMIDLVVAAAFIREQNYYARAGWRPGALTDEARLPVETLSIPRQVLCAVNAVWKDNRLLVPAGGVGIQPDLALEPARLQADKDGKLKERHEKSSSRRPAKQWWWD